MLIKESTTSIKVYFIIISILGGYSSLTLILDGVNLLQKILAVLGILLALGFLVSAARLETFLSRNIEFIFFVLTASGVFLGLKLLLYVFTGFKFFVLLQFVLGVTIFWYLHKNVKRLSIEGEKGE
jgi:hypothetical protein